MIRFSSRKNEHIKTIKTSDIGFRHHNLKNIEEVRVLKERDNGPILAYVSFTRELKGMSIEINDIKVIQSLGSRKNMYHKVYDRLINIVKSQRNSKIPLKDFTKAKEISIKVDESESILIKKLNLEYDINLLPIGTKNKPEIIGIQGGRILYKKKILQINNNLNIQVGESAVVIENINNQNRNDLINEYQYKFNINHRPAAINAMVNGGRLVIYKTRESTTRNTIKSIFIVSSPNTDPNPTDQNGVSGHRVINYIEAQDTNSMFSVLKLYFKDNNIRREIAGRRTNNVIPRPMRLHHYRVHLPRDRQLKNDLKTLFEKCFFYNNINVNNVTNRQVYRIDFDRIKNCFLTDKQGRQRTNALLRSININRNALAYNNNVSINSEPKRRRARINDSSNNRRRNVNNNIIGTIDNRLNNLGINYGLDASNRGSQSLMKLLMEHQKAVLKTEHIKKDFKIILQLLQKQLRS